MSVHATHQPTEASASDASYAEEDRGDGWVMFAGVLMLMVGSVNFIEGVAAIGNARFFVSNTHYIAASLNTWGWVVLWIGVTEFVVALGIFVKNQFARWIGVTLLTLNAGVQLLMMPAYPFWSLCVFTPTSSPSTG